MEGGYSELKLLFLNFFDLEKLIKGPYKAFSHLEGHTQNGKNFLIIFFKKYCLARVVLACWNEVYQKLATSDDSGLIIVWVTLKFI